VNRPTPQSGKEEHEWQISTQSLSVKRRPMSGRRNDPTAATMAKLKQLSEAQKAAAADK